VLRGQRSEAVIRHGLTIFFTHTTCHKEAALAKPNYQFEKRQKDLAKKKKQEEKRQRKLDKSNTPPAETPNQQS
jgi:tmRNA-binding protein